MARHRRPSRSRIASWLRPTPGHLGHPQPAPEPEPTPHTVQLLYPDGSTIPAQWARGTRLGEFVARVPAGTVFLPAAIRVDQRTLIAVLPRREAS